MDGEETFKLGEWVGGWLATVDFAECENALMFCKPVQRDCGHEIKVE